MWKILTEQIRENIYYSQIFYGLFHEQYWRHKRTKGKGNLLYIIQYILKESKKSRKNLCFELSTKRVIISLNVPTIDRLQKKNDYSGQ